MNPLKILIPLLLLLSTVSASPLSSAMLKYNACPIPEGVENPKELSDYINTLSYDYDKAELVNMGVNTLPNKNKLPLQNDCKQKGHLWGFCTIKLCRFKRVRLQLQNLRVQN